MAHLRHQRSFVFPAPPPSPIANGRGLRTAAANDQILSEYLENNLLIPELDLYQSRSLPISHRPIPYEIDLQLLSSRDDESIRLVLESIVEFAVFRIIGHGIWADEIGSMIDEAEMVFPIPVELKRDLNRDKFLWFSSGKTRLRGEIGPERNRSLSQTMNHIFSKLETIADMVGHILPEHVGNKKPGKEGVQVQVQVQGRDPILCLNKTMGPNLSYNDSYHYALSFFLSDTDHEFLVQSARGPLLFNAMGGSIIVTIRKQFQEWRSGEFKGISREPSLVLNSDGSPSFFVEFMCTPSTLTYNNPDHQMRKISLHDQILVVIIILFLYNFFTSISRF